MSELELPFDVVFVGSLEKVRALLRVVDAGNPVLQVPDQAAIIPNFGFAVVLVRDGAEVGRVHVRPDGPLCGLRLYAANPDQAAPAWLLVLRSLHAVGKLRGWKPPEKAQKAPPVKRGPKKSYSEDEYLEICRAYIANASAGRRISQAQHAKKYSIGRSTLSKYLARFRAEGKITS